MDGRQAEALRAWGRAGGCSARGTPAPWRRPHVPNLRPPPLALPPTCAPPLAHPPAPPAPQYMPTIWGLLFARLQSSRTAKFTRALLAFLALFVCKRGAQLVADSIDAVQPGLTVMILQTVRPRGCCCWGVSAAGDGRGAWRGAVAWRGWLAGWPAVAAGPGALRPLCAAARRCLALPSAPIRLAHTPPNTPSSHAAQVWLPTMPSITGAHEEKLLAVATARLLADAQQLAAPEQAELAGRLLAALVSYLEGGAGSGGEDGGEDGGGGGDEEFAGYSAAYARLHNAQRWVGWAGVGAAGGLGLKLRVGSCGLLQQQGEDACAPRCCPGPPSPPHCAHPPLPPPFSPSRPSAGPTATRCQT